MKNTQKLKLESPVKYQIVVQGVIDSSNAPILIQFQFNLEKHEWEQDKTMLVSKVEE